MATEKRTIYAIRDTITGQLVSDITSRRNPYYVRFAFAENAITEYRKRIVKPKHGELEIVEFALEEIVAYEV
jgi:hypothetical protein